MAPSDAVGGSPNNNSEECQANEADRVNVPSPLTPPMKSAKSIKLHNDDKMNETDSLDKTIELPTDKDNASHTTDPFSAAPGNDNCPQAFFPFLRLPPEVRNQVYHEAVVLPKYAGLTRQPALTRVNRQLRLEALPIYYGQLPITHTIINHSWRDCVKSVQKLVDAFAGGPNSVPGPSTLQHISYFELELVTVFPNTSRMLLILSDSMKPDDIYELADSLFNPVRVGDSSLDWADAKAVWAARDEAVEELTA